MAQPRKHEHWSIEGKDGYVRGRGPGPVQRAYLRIGDTDTALGFAFVPANKRQALALLKAEQERREAIRYAERFGMALPEQLRTAEPERGRRTTLHALITMYKHEHYGHISQSARDWHDRGLAFYVTQNVAWDAASQSERRQAYDALKAMLIAANNVTRITDDTKSKYYDYAGLVFDWIVAEEWLNKNPLRSLPKPKRKWRSTKERWTGEEVQKILAELRKIEPTPHFSLATEVLAVGGFRRCELMSMTRDEARENYLAITAKGQTRNIPILAIPGLRELLDRMLALELPVQVRKQAMRPEHLFPFPRTDKWGRLFNKAVKNAGIDPGERTLYCMRKAAIWWMEHTLLWDRQDICDVVGHDEDTDNRYYRQSPEAQDLEDRIQRRTGTVGKQESRGKSARSLPVARSRKGPIRPIQSH